MYLWFVEIVHHTVSNRQENQQEHHELLVRPFFTLFLLFPLQPHFNTTLIEINSYHPPAII